MNTEKELNKVFNAISDYAEILADPDLESTDEGYGYFLACLESKLDELNRLK